MMVEPVVAAVNVQTELLKVMASYLAVIVMAFLLMAWLQGGFLWPFIRCRTSRGKLILVKVKSSVSTYYRAGEIIEGWLLVKDRSKALKRYKVPDGCIYRSMTINMIDVDEEKGTVMSQLRNDEVAGFDAVKYSDLYVRALMRPTLQDKKTMLLVLLVVLVLLVCLFNAYTTYKMAQQFGDLVANLATATTKTVT